MTPRSRFDADPEAEATMEALRRRYQQLRFVHLDSNGSRPLKKPARYSVAEAARQVGYESPSQFSREYKRLFGGTPKETAGRSRSSSCCVLQPGDDSGEASALFGDTKPTHPARRRFFVLFIHTKLTQ